MNKNILIVLAFLLFNIMGYGQKTWTGATSTAWETDSNWFPSGKPTGSDNVLITNAANQPVINVTGAACLTLTLSNSIPSSLVVLTMKTNTKGTFLPASIIMNSTGGDTSDCSLKIEAGRVGVSGNVTMEGNKFQNDVTFSGAGTLSIGGVMTGGTLNADGIGTVDYNGVGARTIGEYTYNNLTLSGSGVKTIATSGVIVNGTLTMAGTASASASPTYGTNAALQYNSLSSQTVGSEWITPFVATGGVEISTSNPGVSIVTINGNGAEKRFNDGVPLIVDEDASLVVNNTEIYLGGDFINNRGSLNTDKFVYLTGSVNQSLDSFTSTEGVAMIKSAGIATFTGNITTKKLTINGLGTLFLGTGLTHTFVDWTRTQGTLNAGSSIFKISGNVIGNGGSFNPATSTVEFNGGAQNLGQASLIYNNLVLSGTGVKTFGAQTTIKDTFSIVPGVIADLTTNLVHSAKYIKIGASAGSGGSWGSSLSNAVNKNDTYFASNNGIINVGPTIVINTTSIAALTTIYGTPSPLKTIDVSGLALLEVIVATAPSGFEVSTDGITFTDAVPVGKAGAFAPIKVYVRLKATANAGSYSSSSLALSSNGTTTVNIPIATSTVNKAVLKVIPTDAARIYGDDDPTLAVTYSGFKNGDDKAVVTTVPTITTTADNKSGITTATNKYEIITTGAQSSNYTFDYTKKGELTITKAVLIITANSFPRERGLANPDLTVTYSGFKNNEDKSVLTKQPTITTTAKTDSPVGNYDIIVDGAEALNYTFQYNKGTLEVTKSSNAGLTDLAISKGMLDPKFSEKDTEYKATVKNDVTSITVTPTTSDSGATIEVNKVDILSETVLINGTVLSGTASGDIPLEVGQNKITTVITAEDGTTKTYTVIVTREPSNEARLSDVVINGVDLNTPFDKDKEESRANVPNETTSIVITPTPMEPNATITMFVDGVEVTDLTAPIDLKVGYNEITYVVKAQDGTTEKEYTVIVNRDEPRLTDLTISKGELNPAFDPKELKYIATVDNDVTSITLTPKTSDTKAIITVNGDLVNNGEASDKIELKVGENTIKTTIIAEDKTETTYEVIVIRKASSDAGLVDIALSGDAALNQPFDTENKGYIVEVPNATDSIIITPTPKDPKATVEMKIGDVTIDPTAPIDLKVGDTVITVVVFAEDGTPGEPYEVTVTRAEPADKPSENAGLSDIVINDGTKNIDLNPVFDTDVKKYEIDVPYETDSITITPKTIDPEAKVVMTIDGVEITDPTAPIDLKVGYNEITIVVRSEDGTVTEEYIVIVNRADEVPQAIVPSNIVTPNGDGKNDTWVVPGIDKYPNNSVKVFDRAARLVYSKDNYNNDWDGTFKGSPVNEDTYYYLIDLGNGSPKLKGFISILRN